jgi:transposase
VADGAGLPHAVDVAAASPAEITLVEAVLSRHFIGSLLERLIGDKAYDSDPLNETLQELGIEMIASSRAKRRRKTQDGCPLRRYRRRWKVEKLMAWLHNFRRTVSRCEVKVENYLGFVQLGCIRILLRQAMVFGIGSREIVAHSGRRRQVFAHRE